ncbi:MAG TPA: M48 family metallopeptidase [Terracidiphilus sp.]|jgi:STE24 endopeptidase
MTGLTRKFSLWLLITLAGCVAASAQPAIQPTVDITKVPAAAQPSPQFDAEAATNAYMAMMPPEAIARSNAYFEGGYWLILWNFLYGSAIALLLLNLRWSARMRDAAVRITRFQWLQSMLYWVQYLVAATLLGFPLEYYENYVREHKYGLATQSFGPWMGDELKGILVSLVAGAIIFPLLLAMVRWVPRSWWIWGALVTCVFSVIFVALGPVFLQPIFNNPKKLDDPKITGPILKMAHANGIPTNDVWEIDASKQTTRMSANVSGFGKTMRITLNDNLLKRGSPEEIQAVMGHEMGHYVMNHIPKLLFFLAVVIVCSFAYLNWILKWALSRWGERWQIGSLADPAILPLVTLMAGVLFFVLTPVFNTETRTQEKEADMFGLNASRQPDGFAQAAIHLGEYRKMHPGPAEEFLFFDHPSGYNRIHSAMVWKSQNLELYEAPRETAGQR